jgi:hypothetical protein
MSATAIQLLAECRSRGISLRPGAEGKLKVSPPPERLPAELREALRRHKTEVLALLQQQEPSTPPDYRRLYRQVAESITEDCFSLPPAWLLDHPAFYEQIRALDEQLTAMEREGTDKLGYETTLVRLVRCVQDARRRYEREQTGKAVVQ